MENMDMMDGEAAPREGMDMDEMVGLTNEEAEAKAIETQKKMNAILEARLARQQKENPNLSPDDLGDEAQSAASYFMCCQFWVVFTITMTIMVIAQLSKGGQTCGIDPISWVQGYFAIVLLQATLQFSCWFLMKCKCSEGCIVTWLIVGLVFSLYLLIAWIIIGYTQYFSDANDCQSSPDNFGWLVVMVILMFFGLSIILCGVMLICVGCCVLCCLAASEPGEVTRSEQISQVGGASWFYNPAAYKHSSHCSICLEDYKEGDKILTLACSDKHYFHYDCLLDYVNSKNQGTTCPLCQAPIATGEAPLVDPLAGKPNDEMPMDQKPDDMGAM